jgi:DNA-binding XRE family transcriptional regulator
MSGQDFKKIVEGICITHNTNKTAMSKILGISKVTLNIYEKNGVPIQKVPLIMYRMKYYMCLT